MSNIPIVEYSEATPNGFEHRSLGASRLRELKTQLREILGVDHIVASSGNGATWGLHNKISFKDNPTAVSVADSLVLYAEAIAGKTELHFIDESDNYIQLTSGGSFVAGIVGEIRMFKGTLATIPIGWGLCDGTSGKPNLTAKFIRGVNSGATNPGTTGGSDTHTLSEAEMAGHTHVVTGDYEGGGAGGKILYGTITFVGGAQFPTGSAGSGTSFTKKPAYYECAYIIKL